MANTNSKDLDEKLSPWGITLEGQKTHEKPHSPTAQDKLNEKLSLWGTSVQYEWFATKKQLLERLLEWGIHTETVEHAEVFTVEQALPHLSHVQGMFAKNLFLRDKKKKLYLFCAPHDAKITLNDLAKVVGVSGGFRFADEVMLQQKLGLKQGAVTVFGLINDQYHDVKLILDKSLINGTYSKVLFHPLVNSATSAITPGGLKKFLAHTGHKPILIDISR